MSRTGRTLFLTGDRELDNKLRTLPFKVQGRILRDGQAYAMAPVLSEAQQQYPVRTGKAKKRLRIKSGKPQRRGDRIVRVGMFGGATKYRQGKKSVKVPTGRLLEFGAQGTTTKLTPRQILRRALAKHRERVLSRLAFRLKVGIINAAT